MLELKEYIKIAYKKLKASVYFDKTQLPLRDKITTFESRSKIENKLEKIVKAVYGTSAEWKRYQ